MIYCHTILAGYVCFAYVQMDTYWKYSIDYLGNLATDLKVVDDHFTIHHDKFSSSKGSSLFVTDFLGENEFMIRWGNVWSDNTSIIPLSRVQHVDQEQDMLAKWLGITELMITTAGGHHFIMGLKEEDAVRLRRQNIELSKLDEKDAYYD